MFMIINKSKVKEIAELQVSEEVYEELEKIAEKVFKKGEDRAKRNGRKTVYAKDL